MNLYRAIRDFHEKFGLEGPEHPTPLGRETFEFRMKFMREELAELQTAYDFFDMEEQLDALVDLVYVALGTAYMMGFDFDEAFHRVHKANMKKVRAAPDGSDSKRGSSLDVVKPEGWRPADLSDLV